MRILMVSSFLPYPLFSGGHVRLYNIIKELSKKHVITLVCEQREYQTDKDVKEVTKFCKDVITVPRKKQWTVANIMKTGFSPFPFLLARHSSPEMKGAIKQVIKSSPFDLIHVETFYVMQNLPKTSLPVVLVEHNIEYLVYKRFSNTIPALLRFPLLIDVSKMQYWEEQFWKQADRLVAVSQEDKKMMGRNDVVIVPNGVDVNKLKVENGKLKIKEEEKRILFIGDFKWVQNRDAARWILTEIWPKTQKSKLPLRSEASKSQNSLKLWIVGRNIPESIKNLTNDKDIVFDERADDTVEIFKNATVLLAPVRVGGGTSFKILEAMASGVPVITTSLGATGLGAQDGKEILIADEADTIVEKLTELLSDIELYTKIAKNARKLIEKNFDWRIIVKKLENVYTSTIAKRNV